MSVVTIKDLNFPASMYALGKMRQRMPAAKSDTVESLKEVVGVVGGRLSFLNKVSRQSPMMSEAQTMLAEEKAWLRSQIGLIKDCDDDVMDEQKWASCTWLLLQEFVNERIKQEKELQERIAAGIVSTEELPLPAIPYHLCRSIMTRTDFLEGTPHLLLHSTRRLTFSRIG
jgi:hypothetical protein